MTISAKAARRCPVVRRTGRLAIRPFIHIELGIFAQDVLPEMMQCEGDEVRVIEAHTAQSS